MGEGHHAELRDLPSVHELAAALDAPHTLAVAAARRAIEEHRSLLIAKADASVSIIQRARGHLAALASPSLRPVINATGVILHTNLGRAPLARSAREAVARAAGYSNLELELDTGARGSRHDHVADLLGQLTGAPAAMVVGNGAGAVLLAVAALAGSGRGVIVSRGQLVEIGGGFRIPDVVAQSGAALIEVGTTNRTHRRDYEHALAGGAPVAAILRVHQSNFRTQGFVADVPIEELCALGVPVIDDLGSGVLSGAAGILALGDEPDLERSIAAGAALVCCSGDKLLGGPQAGLLIGTEAAIAAARSHPLARALRIDKLSLAALEATLALHRDPATARREIPVLAMLDLPESELALRARRLRDGIGGAAELIRVQSKVGGGALPLAELQGPAVALRGAIAPDVVARRLRAGDPPVIARVHDGRLVLDPRTLTDAEIATVVAAVRVATGAG
ncbi:MAG: L-seryl-tRNA(Sec) selenium transferase [Actinomycetota bacterium]|nr:L-seryl-tRNA(Sec) selenium transferase [Actinomycetota bacterium]